MLSESPIVGGDFAFGRPVERLLPYTAEQLFDLAADVERYPAYLPLWIAARIVKREADAYETKQVVGFGPVRFAFQSHTVMRRPEHIEVTSDDPHFRGFRLSWNFESQPNGKCLVRLVAAVQPHSRLLQHVVKHALELSAEEIIAAFEAQARKLYGPHSLRKART